VAADLIAQLFDQYGGMVYQRALNIMGNPADAEEVTQEVFIRALNGLERFRGGSKTSTWLYSITTRHCLNLIRDRKRRRELMDEKVRPDAETVTEAARMEDVLLGRYLLAEADPQQALAAVCVFVEGMSQEEAAEVVGVSRRSVGNLLTRFTEWAKKRAARGPP